MREIKFRAWDKERKIMIEEYAHQTMFGGLTSAVFPDHCPYFILMQFTGLKDKNGKEIYELDIISDLQGKGIVYWIPEFVCFGVQEIPDRNRTFAFGKDLPIKNGRLEETEIIGNIYENFQLLEPPLGNNASTIRNISEDDLRKDDL